MPRYLVICCAAIALASCGGKRPPVTGIPPVADPCPAEGLAPLRSEPVDPVPDASDRGKVFGAIAQAIGPDRAQALIRFLYTEVPTWGRQGWERSARVKTWCDNR